jgi:hypothetical protein
MSHFHRDLIYSSAYSSDTAHIILGVPASYFNLHFLSSKSSTETSFIVQPPTVKGSNFFSKSRFNNNQPSPV